MKIAEMALGAWVVVLGLAVINLFLPFGLHWPNASGDWATWVSGIGSVAAAVAAVRIATQTQRQQQQEARAALSLFIESSVKVVGGIRYDCTPGEVISGARARRREIQVLLSFGQKIEVGRLREDEARMALTVQQTLAHIEAFIEDDSTQTDMDVAGIDSLYRFLVRHTDGLR